MWFFAACSLMSFLVWPSPYYVCEDYISFGYCVKRAAHSVSRMFSLKKIIEPRHEKTNLLHMRQQRRRSASR